MQKLNLRALDLNLLIPLQALLEERSVTRAAGRVHLSQPAMSRAFARLRETFFDDLLVRSGKRYSPDSKRWWIAPCPSLANAARGPCVCLSTSWLLMLSKIHRLFLPLQNAWLSEEWTR